MRGGAMRTTISPAMALKASAPAKTNPITRLTDLLHHASGSGPVSIGCDFENGVVTRFLST
jgi:beta-glucosidase-like glycosyl hydrolase